MLAEERQNAIVSQVNLNGSVLVKELSGQFGVTPDSIRKDLTLLEKRGLLKKTYGGAVKLRVNLHDFYASERKHRNVREKQVIAHKALDLIDSGDFIFLDISTANIELAKLLQEARRHLTVCTNMIEVMQLFAVNPAGAVDFLFFGDTMSHFPGGFVGSLTNQEIERCHY